MFIWEQIKLTGILGFITALICILVTITTAIIHIQRLQSLKECEFTPKDSICTCYSQILGRTDAWTRSKEGEFNIFFFHLEFMLMQTWLLLSLVVLCLMGHNHVMYVYMFYGLIVIGYWSCDLLKLIILCLSKEICYNYRWLDPLFRLPIREWSSVHLCVSLR